jgi:SRSO17 transposase
VLLADAGYGTSAMFRHALSERGLTWTVGILRIQTVYPTEVTVLPRPRSGRGRPPKHPFTTAARMTAEQALGSLPSRAWRTITWRLGTKGPLCAKFAARRVRVADGVANARGQHLPGDEVWLVGERRSTGERKYYLTNQVADTPLRVLAAVIKARWVCEQAHQQLKDELGLDHFEGRSWSGLHHHALLTMLAFAFLQSLRLRRITPDIQVPDGPPPQPSRADESDDRAAPAGSVPGRWV